MRGCAGRGALIAVISTAAVVVGAAVVDRLSRDSETIPAVDTLRRFLDDEDCALATGQYLYDAYELWLVLSPRPIPVTELCRQDATEGVEANDYVVERVRRVDERRTEITIAVRPAERRTYVLVSSDGGWKVDASTSESRTQRARFGTPLRYRDSYVVDDIPVDARLEFTPESLVRKPLPPSRTRGGRTWWYDVQYRISSAAAVDIVIVPQTDFAAVAADGTRYEPAGRYIRQVTVPAGATIRRRVRFAVPAGTLLTQFSWRSTAVKRVAPMGRLVWFISR